MHFYYVFFHTFNCIYSFIHVVFSHSSKAVGRQSKAYSSIPNFKPVLVRYTLVPRLIIRCETENFLLFFFRTMMGQWFTVASAVVIALGTVQFRAILANGNSSTSRDGKERKNLFVAWIEKPPYTASASNESLDNEVHGLIRDVIFRYVFYDCSYNSRDIRYNVTTNRVDSEFRMIELLSQNRVHLAAPVFEPIDRRYREFPFVKLVDYPGTDFITTEDETKGLKVVLDAVLKSWPLFVVTVILTAIAGVIMWALVSFV